MGGDNSIGLKVVSFAIPGESGFYPDLLATSDSTNVTQVVVDEAFSKFQELNRELSALQKTQELKPEIIRQDKSIDKAIKNETALLNEIKGKATDPAAIKNNSAEWRRMQKIKGILCLVGTVLGLALLITSLVLLVSTGAAGWLSISFFVGAILWDISVVNLILGGDTQPDSNLPKQFNNIPQQEYQSFHYLRFGFGIKPEELIEKLEKGIELLETEKETRAEERQKAKEKTLLEQKSLLEEKMRELTELMSQLPAYEGFRNSINPNFPSPPPPYNPYNSAVKID